MKNFIDELFYGFKNTFVFITVFFITLLIPILGFTIVIVWMFIKYIKNH